MRFLTYINPRNWFHKQPDQGSQDKTSVLSVKDFKPLLILLGQTFTNSKNTSSDAIAEKLSQIKNKISFISIIPPKSSVIIEHEMDNFSADHLESIEAATFKTEELGQQFKKIWYELNITQISGDEVAHRIADYLQKELPSRNELNDFFNDIDEVSLRVGQLHAHVKQLTSSYEIN
jgi:hypothetical protein